MIAINNVGLFNETQEALEQQKAASEVLQVISRSTFDLQSVFHTLVENAVRLCGAKTGMIFQRDDAIMRVAAASGATPEFVAYVQNNPIAPGRGAITGRAALDGRTVHVLDIENDPEYSYGGLSLEAVPDDCRRSVDAQWGASRRFHALAPQCGGVHAPANRAG